MNARHCPGCNRVTGHKRAIGVGTLLLALLTLGFSLLLVPFYPTRCAVCGLSGKEQPRRVSPLVFGAVVALVVFVILARGGDSRTAREVRSAPDESRDARRKRGPSGEGLASRSTQQPPVPASAPASRPAEENAFARRWREDPELFGIRLHRLVEKTIRDTLRDPEGARFEWEPVRRTTDGGWMVTFSVNAKNGFGGYAGRQRFQAWFDKNMEIVDCRELAQ
ncbi:MAG: hypothetical protein L0323_09310 [Planctomycetes bacterium]|nr:hypothetical protein [Planctomycetota bacterium]